MTAAAHSSSCTPPSPVRRHQSSSPNRCGDNAKSTPATILSAVNEKIQPASQSAAAEITLSLDAKTGSGAQETHSSLSPKVLHEMQNAACVTSDSLLSNIIDTNCTSPAPSLKDLSLPSSRLSFSSDDNISHESLPDMSSCDDEPSLHVDTASPPAKQKPIVENIEKAAKTPTILCPNKKQGKETNKQSNESNKKNTAKLVGGKKSDVTKRDTKKSLSKKMDIIFSRVVKKAVDSVEDSLAKKVSVDVIAKPFY